MAYNPYPQYNPYLQQPLYQQPQMQTVQQPAQAAASPGIVWVQGESGAKSYLVAAGNSVLLMDSESSAFYIKSTDQSGMPLPLRIFDYKERSQVPQQNATFATQNNSLDYITREEFEQRIAALMPKKEVTADA